MVVKTSRSSSPVPNASESFGAIFDLIIPGTFIKLGMDTNDLKYWLVEKQIGNQLLVSHSYHTKNGIKAVKKLISNSTEVSDVRLPKYASATLDKMMQKIGVKQSVEIPTLNTPNILKEYDSVETLVNMANLLQNKFGVTVNFIHSEELGEFREAIPNVDDLRAFVMNGEYYINADKASIADPLHEYLHMVLGSMKYSNPEQYTKLVESIENHPLFAEVSEVYDEVNLDRLEETFIRLFTDTVQHTINQQGVFSEEVFDNAVKEGIVNMFDLQGDMENEFSYDLLDTEVREILTGFSSSLIEGGDSMYNKDNAVEMISISSTLRSLIKNGNLKEQCNG